MALPLLSDIAVRRKKLGLTQSELAKICGVSQSFMAKVEAGTTDPGYSRMCKIFQTLESLERKTTRNASDVLNKDVFKISENDLVSRAIKLMNAHGISQLPVFRGDVPVGSISEKTLLPRLAEGETTESLSRHKISEIMDEVFPVISADTPADVISRLLENNAAVLVSRRGKVVGIITKSDFLKK